MICIVDSIGELLMSNASGRKWTGALKQRNIPVSGDNPEDWWQACVFDLELEEVGRQQLRKNAFWGLSSNRWQG
jgi:hypothetical protein